MRYGDIDQVGVLWTKVWGSDTLQKADLFGFVVAFSIDGKNIINT